MQHYKNKYIAGIAIFISILIFCGMASGIFAENKDGKSANSSGESKEINSLKYFQKQIFEINNHINYLKAEIEDTEDSLAYFSDLLNNAGYNRRLMRQELTRLSAKMYIQHEYSFDEFLISGDAGRDELDEIYFIEIIKKTVSKHREISKYVDSTHLIIDKLYSRAIYHEKLLKNKYAENEKLNKAIKGYKLILKKIRNNPPLLDEYMRTKIISSSEIKNRISKLVTKETKELSGKETQGIQRLPFGKLSWPVNSRNILVSYGYSKSRLGSITYENPGIDITVKSGANVINSAAGTVDRIFWLPGYGSVIIIDHGDNIRTVYSGMEIYNVRKGDKLNKGSIIGESGESVEGESLHFELWWGNSKLNPLTYLK